MSATTESVKFSPSVPLPDLELLATAMSSAVRWRMLKELTCGEARTIGEMARVGGVSYAAAAKHLIRLCAAGLVVRGRGRLYQIPKHFLPTPGQPVVDFGHCVLRLDAV